MIDKLGTNWPFILFLMISAQDILFKEAAKILQEVSLNSKNGIVLYAQLPKKLPKQSFYTYVCMYNIGDLQKIKKYIQIVLKQGIQEFNTLLKALWSISLCVIENSIFGKSIEGIYRYLANSKQLKLILINSGFFPTRYQELFQKQLKDQNSENLSKINQNKNIIKTIKNDDQLNCKIHEIKLRLLISSLDSANIVQDQQSIWIGIVQYLGKHNVDSIILIDLIISMTIKEKKYKQFVFLISNLRDSMEQQLLIEQLMLKIPISQQQCSKTNQTEAKPLGILMDNYSRSGIISNLSLIGLALMIKYEIGNLQIIFNKLSPSLCQINKFCNERSEFHNELLINVQNKMIELGKDNLQKRSVWTELIQTQKFKLLTQLIMLNCFTKFKAIICKFQLKVDYIYHTPIYFAITELYEWAINPLLKKIQIQLNLPQNQYKCSEMVQGDLLQFQKINEYFFSRLGELFNYGGCFMFARRSTFIQTCVLFIQICKGNKGLTFEGDQDHKKGIYFIFNWLKKYIIPSLQFYSQDRSLYDLLNTLISCFKFNLQITLLFDILKSKAELPLQLTYIMWETSVTQKKLLNRISNKSEEIILKEILRILQNQPFSSMKAIFQRLLIGSQNIIQQIVQIILPAHHVVKKIMIVYLFLYLTEDEDNLVNSNGTFSQNFMQIVSFMRFYIVKETNSGEIIKILFDYLLFKLKPLNQTIFQANKFQFFHTQITFFHSLFGGIIPYEDMEGNTSNQDPIIRRALLWGGPYLKVAILNKGNEFIFNKQLRLSIIKNLLNKSNALESNLYRLLNKLFQRQRQILQSQYYNISHSSYLIDQINSFVFNLLEILFLQINSKQIQIYLNFQLINSLLNTCHIPYQICFVILRKGISEIYTENQINWRDQKYWKTIKNVYHPAIENYIQNTLKNKKKVLQSRGKNVEPIRQLQWFMKHDLFLFFWLCEPSMFLYQGSYRQILYDKVQLRQGEKGFKRQLDYEQSKFQRANKIFKKCFKGNKHKNIFQNTFPILQEKNSDNLISFIQQFIRTCIIPRSLLSKTDAYFSWKYFFNLLIRNNISIPMIFRLTCRLRELICDFVLFGTKREVTHFLPILFQSSDEFIKFWHSRHILQQKFKRYQNIGSYDNISWPRYNQIKRMLKQSYDIIIHRLTQNYSQMFTVRNSLTFISECSFIPMVKDETEEIDEFINKIMSKYGDCKDIIILTNSTKAIVQKRNEKAYLKSKKSEDGDDEDRQSQTSSRSNKSISPQFSEDKDLDTVSHISINSHESQSVIEDVTDSYLKSLYKNDNLLNSIMEQGQEDIKDSENKMLETLNNSGEVQMSSKIRYGRQYSLSDISRL